MKFESFLIDAIYEAYKNVIQDLDFQNGVKPEWKLNDVAWYRDTRIRKRILLPVNVAQDSADSSDEDDPTDKLYVIPLKVRMYSKC